MNELTPILKIFLSGWLILLVAIMVNSIINATSISGWYEYFNAISLKGLTQANKEMGFINLFFLYLIYPFLLGLCAYILRHWF